MDNKDYHTEKPKKSRARTRRGTKATGLSQEWKDKISATKILNRLLACVDGTVELNSQQIKAADIILRKIVPDLARQEVQQLDKEGKPTDAVSKIVIEHVSAKE